MEIRIYDSAFNFQGVIESQTSLQWTRRYHEAGEFELHLPITAYNVKLLTRGNVVFVRGKKEAGVIEEIELETKSYTDEMSVSGRFLERYLGRRIIRGRYIANSKKTEVIMRELVYNNCINVNAPYKIPMLELGEEKGLGVSTSFQATYKNVLKYIEKLAQSAEVGFRCRPDFTNKKIIFEAYEGTDHSVGQSKNNRVFFSDDYDNISVAQYEENDKPYISKVYVGGSGEYPDRTIVPVENKALTGVELREAFLNASGIKSDDYSTTAQYQEALYQRGLEYLTENALSQSFEAETTAINNFTYGVDYDLGDIVTIRKNSWGLSQDLRLTEMNETYEKGAYTLSPTFGNPLPTTIDWEDNDNG